MGDTTNCLETLNQLSEMPPRILNAKGILISTFTSVLNVNEITAFYKMENKNFLVFELDDKNSGYNITKKNISDGLFSFLDDVKSGEDLVKKVFMDSNRAKSSKISTKNLDVDTVKDEYEISEVDIEKMVPSEKQEMINKLIDNGVENLTEKDKKLLQLLSK
jgi:hypothetical protein